MTDTTVSDALVYPQDGGTGLSDNTSDIMSGGLIGQHAQAVGGDAYVGNGLDFVNVDTSNDQVDVTAGHAFIVESGVSVQSGGQDDFDTTLPDAMTYLVVLPTDVVDLALDGGSVNELWVALDSTTNDSVFIRHGSGLSEPAAPSVKLGSVDTNDGGTTRASDDLPTAVESFSTAGSQGTVPTAQSDGSLVMQSVGGGGALAWEEDSNSPYTATSEDATFTISDTGYDEYLARVVIRSADDSQFTPYYNITDTGFSDFVDESDSRTSNSDNGAPLVVGHSSAGEVVAWMHHRVAELTVQVHFSVTTRFADTGRAAHLSVPTDDLTEARFVNDEIGDLSYEYRLYHRNL